MTCTHDTHRRARAERSPTLVYHGIQPGYLDLPALVLLTCSLCRSTIGVSEEEWARWDERMEATA